MSITFFHDQTRYTAKQLGSQHQNVNKVFFNACPSVSDWFTRVHCAARELYAFIVINRFLFPLITTINLGSHHKTNDHKCCHGENNLASCLSVPWDGDELLTQTFNWNSVLEALP